MASELPQFQPRVPEYVQQSQRILDAGCGPKGSYWWKYKPDHVPMVAIDLYFKPADLPPNTIFIQSDLVDFCLQNEYYQYFDLCVADHILEHVPDPMLALQAINRVLTPGGAVHVGIPDSSLFTDRFYHLIHAEGGGHISKITKSEFENLAKTAGFELEWCAPWPDDWMWFRQGYDWKGRKIQYLTQGDIEFIADVFVKELTPDKGYYYGWEFVLRKDRTVEKPEMALETRKDSQEAGALSTEEIIRDKSQPRNVVKRPFIKRFFSRLGRLLRRI